ncbi:excisionase family DNA-binding protein [Yimella sp. cx-573]|nr:excisionase family DNA-binding protein [Yimella sp. cx-573]
MNVVDLRTLARDTAAAQDAVLARLTLTVDEAAVVLGVSRDVAYRAIEAGELPSLRLGRRIVIPAAKLLDLLGAGERSA